MRAYPECIPCLVRQGLNAAEKLKLPPEKLYAVVREAAKYLSQFETYDRSPAHYAYYIQQIVKRLTGKEDPFGEIKRISNLKALELLDKLNVENYLKGDPLRRAVKLSAIGNILDFAILSEEEAFRKLNSLMEKDFSVDHFGWFERELNNSSRILILGDNAGEIVFDKVLVRVLKGMGKEVVYAVKGGPILNDATIEDAKMVSLTDLCKVISNGNDRVGTDLSAASQEFLKEWERADIVISKGQANFETLSDVEDKTIYFLLTTKCRPITLETGASNVGSLVFKRNIPIGEDL